MLLGKSLVSGLFRVRLVQPQLASASRRLGNGRNRFLSRQLPRQLDIGDMPMHEQQIGVNAHFPTLC